ncbi:MAG: hypothetical protein WC026_16885 [Hyphomicrobium sp.]|uniref:hypothetical protein n=1 Tax=Hyphomicrobium sp. TaxID=82 RepID=UPI00356B2FFF
MIDDLLMPLVVLALWIAPENPVTAYSAILIVLLLWVQAVCLAVFIAVLMWRDRDVWLTTEVDDDPSTLGDFPHIGFEFPRVTR